MNTARLAQLERDLRAFPQKNVPQFSLRHWHSGAIAWFCKQHPTWTLKMWQRDQYTLIPQFGTLLGLDALQEYFGLDHRQAYNVFSASSYADWPDGETGPREVANRIRVLLSGPAEDDE